MLAICYSAAAMRARTVVNSTRLLPHPNEPKQPAAAPVLVRCQGGFCPPLPRLRFSDSCQAIFQSPSLFGVDRNVELVPWLCDNLGQRVRTLNVAPLPTLPRMAPVHFSFVQVSDPKLAQSSRESPRFAAHPVCDLTSIWAHK